MSSSTKSSDFEPVSVPDGGGAELFSQPDGQANPARRRKAAAEAESVATVTLPLSHRVIEYFQAEGDDWLARINESLNLIVNRHIAREAKKRARLRARTSARRRAPRAGA
ncbi:MAG: BrnA antitoxin family protein [Candidatus Kaistia colombiensis]|nr:MAG: BrnA antitoxin family protein [Kaistia sp.]